MRVKNLINVILNILSVILILIAVAVTVMIYATDNRYSEPIFGETMLLAVRSDSAAEAKPGALALVDLTYKTSAGASYATFLGGGTRITKDPMGAVGTVKGYIPALGGAMDFFRDPAGFFLLIVLPLSALIIRQIVRLILLLREGGRHRPGGGGRC